MIVHKMQPRWAGQLARMSDDRIPKQLLFGELTTGTRTVGRPFLRWKDSFKGTLKQSNISTTQWQDIATDRSTWRRSIHDGLMLYDDSRRDWHATKRARRHAARNATPSASEDTYTCPNCWRTWSSRIGIQSHERAFNKQRRGRDTWQPSSYQRAALHIITIYSPFLLWSVPFIYPAALQKWSEMGLVGE